MSEDVNDNRKRWPASDRYEPNTDYDVGGKYHKVRVYTTRAGQSVEFDETQGGERIRIINRDRSYFEMQHDGTMILRANGNSHEVVVKDKTLRIKGSWDVKADGDVTIRATNIKLYSDTLTHNDVDIGYTHKHKDVMPGPALTGPPVGGKG